MSNIWGGLEKMDDGRLQFLEFGQLSHYLFDIVHGRKCIGDLFINSSSFILWELCTVEVRCFIVDGSWDLVVFFFNK